MRFLLEQPELLGALGIAEQFGYRRHNAHLDDVAVAKTKRGFAAWRDYLDNLKSYDVAAPNARPATFHARLEMVDPKPTGRRPFASTNTSLPACKVRRRIS
jgi:hypothetical protein